MSKSRTFVLVESFVFEQKVPFKVEYLSSISLSVIWDLRVLLAQGGARGQNLEHLFFYLYLLFYGCSSR